MLYQRTKLSTGKAQGDPGPLPAEIAGLDDASLADLPDALKPCPEQFLDTGFTPVAIAPPATAASFVVDVPTFLLRLTPQERVAIRKSTDELVVDFQRLLDDPRVLRINLALPAVEQAVGYLASVGLISADRVPAILAPEGA